MKNIQMKIFLKKIMKRGHQEVIYMIIVDI